MSDDPVGKAFDFAQECVKQFITLATGIIALSITFASDFIGTLQPAAQYLAMWSWAAHLLSVLFGSWTLLALTGSFEPTTENARPSIWGRNVTVPAGLQVLAFFAGLVLTVVFGIRAMPGGG